MSEDSDFNIELKEGMHCLQSLCSYFMESKNKRATAINENENDLCKCPISNVDSDLNKSISEAEKSISTMNLRGGHDYQVNSKPLSSSSFNLEINMEPILEINISSEEKMFFHENYDDEPPPMKRVKFTNNNIVCDQNTQTNYSHEIIRPVKKMINTKTQTDDNYPSKIKPMTYFNNAITQTDEIIIQHDPASLKTIEEIKKIIDNRRKRVSSLSSSIQEASNFLDELKQVLNPGATTIKPPPSTTIINPPTSSTNQSGYARHFDFPAKPRYCKLPIILENSNGPSSQKSQSKTLMINKINKVEPTRSIKRNCQNNSQKKRWLLQSNKENYYY